MTRTNQLDTRPRAAAIAHDQAMRMAITEYQRTIDAWDELSEADWTRPTDCPAWTVHQIAVHVYGMARMAASPLEMMRQNRAAASLGGGIDNLTAHQVEKYGELEPAELVVAMRAVAPKAARGRRRIPSFVRSRALSERQVVDGVEEVWTIGFGSDVIFTRDPWMHRADLARATGRPMNVSADHDGVIVDGVVREWADRHGQPFDLTLTGPAGGHWSEGTGGEVIEMDAVDFCRVLSGRGTGDGLLATKVPF
jgi:uncharacterized protein (TIGR03083 family)